MNKVMKLLTINAKKPNGFWGNMMISKMNVHHMPLLNWSIGKLNINSNSKVLDIGCGGGMAVNIMAQRAGLVCGVDYSKLAVKRAKKLNRKLIKQSKVKIMNASVSSLPFEADEFDIITAFETIYFWPNILEDLKEVKRVLKNNGKLLIVCEMVKNEKCSVKQKQVVEFLKLNEDNYNSKDELKKLLEETGFKNIELFEQESENWLAVIAS